MAETQTQPNHPEEHDEETSEITFHIGPRSDVRPFRWVAGITTPKESWQHYDEANATEGLDTITVELPSRMSQNLMRYAREHIGPNATEKQIDHWCHTFAREVGATALSMIPTQIMGGEHGLADAQAQNLYTHGEIIHPSELAVEEHAVVGDADPDSSHRAPYHSMVGIGRPKGDETGPNLAIQVDTSRGSLYIGDPADYLEDIKKEGAHLRKLPQPELYVQRTPKTVHPNGTVQDPQNGAS